MINRDNNFQCDMASKQVLMETLQNVYPTEFKYDILENPYARFDCSATGYTINKEITYAIEHKERDMESTRYNEYFMEVHKYKTLKEQLNNGYTKAYFTNSFTDGVIMMWDVDKIDATKVQKRWISNTTKGTSLKDKKKVLQERIMLPVNNAIIIK